MTRRGTLTRAIPLAVAALLAPVAGGASAAAADGGAVHRINIKNAVIPIPLDNAVIPLQTKEVEGGTTTIDIKSDVLFEFDSATLTSQARAHLRELANKLSDVTGTIHVDGYTDSIGSASYNQKLSERRAEAVKEVLEQQLGSGVTVEAEGHGENNPVAPNRKGGEDNPAGRAKNRRVEISYTSG